MNALHLALADLRHDAANFFCAVVLIVAIIGPLLVLLGVKVGAVSVLFSELRERPENLAVFVDGAHEFSSQDVARVRSIPGVAFAEGQNLVTTAGTIALRAVPDGDRAIGGSYGTTGEGDPLTSLGTSIASDQVILSAAFAKRLRVNAGENVGISLRRGAPVTGAIEPSFIVLEVLPEKSVAGNFVLLSAEAISLIEAYSFGYAVPSWGVDQGLPLSQRVDAFEKIRIYASDIEALPDLAKRVEDALGVQTSSREQEVRAILRLEGNLDAIFAFVASAGLIGMVFVMAAHFWSAVRRKRQSWSMLSLMGASPLSLAAIPVFQAILVSLAGFLGGLLVYFSVAGSISAWFGAILEVDQSIASLPLGAALLVGVIVVSASIMASGAAAMAVMRTDPAAIIRMS